MAGENSPIKYPRSENYPLVFCQKHIFLSRASQRERAVKKDMLSSRKPGFISDCYA